MYPESIKKLIECFKKLPGIGEKTAERLAYSCLSMSEDTVNIFSSTLKDIKEKIKKCKTCGNLTEKEYCPICEDNTRNKETICVVEESKNIIAFEKLGKYNGTYHVLNGLISPLDGINPEDINIEKLKTRIKEEKPKEIIIAVRPTIEGETTALYIQKLLKSENIKITKLAQGVPMGADIDYMDPLTLEIALSTRNEIS